MEGTRTTHRGPDLPPRVLPLLYLGFAHAALGAAFAAVIADPIGVAAFFYHPRMLAIVHLVTLGWITGSILGALYLVAPIALRTHLPAGRFDYAAFALYAAGVAGMVSHFWIAEYGGMAWSGATVTVAVAIVAARAAGPLRRAAIPGAVRTHVALAFLNFGVAATAGVVIGVQKLTRPFLPATLLAQVFAHAHVAAIGWGSMMVVGIAYRLLPMVLPARMPGERTVYASAVLLQTGVGGLFVTLMSGGTGTWWWSIPILAGFGAFGLHVIGMLRHRLPRPPAIRTPDAAHLHAAASAAALVVACGLGTWLSLAAPSELTLRVASAYGALGLVGFLSQMVVAMEARLLTLHAWYWAFANASYRHPGFSPHDMAHRPTQLAACGLWVAGVPCLAAGLGFASPPLVRGAGGVLFLAIVLDTAQLLHVSRRAFARTTAP